MKVLVVGDLHGNKPDIHFKDFDCIIAPGDFCGDSHRKYLFEVLRKNLENPDHKISLEDLVGKRKAKKMEDKSFKEGRDILKLLDSTGVPVFSVPGNWESSVKDWNRLKKGLKNIKDINFKKRSFNKIDFIGYGFVSGPEYPQYEEDKKLFKKDELKKRKIKMNKKKERLSKLFRKSKNPIIFVPHNVPFKTKLDKINNKKSPRHGYHYGSLIARDIVEEHKPLLCIGGHMHEHFGKDKIGKTVCLNAGFGKYVNTLIDIDEGKGKIRNIKFWRGK